MYCSKARHSHPSGFFSLSLSQISLVRRNYSSIAKGLQNAISIDFHYQHRLIYWSDVSLDVIMRAFMNGTGEMGEEMIVKQVNSLVQAGRIRLTFP